MAQLMEHGTSHHSDFCLDLVSPDNTRAAVFNLAVGLPALAFLIFLAWHARSSLQKLKCCQSCVMTTYYFVLWAVGLLNLLRCTTQIGSLSHWHPMMWNVMWLVDRFGMVMLECSAVVFHLQGYLPSTQEAAWRTMWTSGALALLDTIISGLFVFIFHVPLFLFAGSPGQGADARMRRDKWAFWLAHTVVFAVLYAVVLVLPRTHWGDVLPKPSPFYRYIRVLLALNVVSAVGVALILSCLAGGYCVYAWSTWLYWAGYLPLLYITFLAEFFATETLDLDQMYYEEMSAAGFLEEEEADGVFY